MTNDNEITMPKPLISSESVCSITGRLISLYMAFSPPEKNLSKFFYAINSVVNSATEITIPRMPATKPKVFSILNLLRFNIEINQPQLVTRTMSNGVGKKHIKSLRYFASNFLPKQSDLNILILKVFKHFNF